MVLRCVFLSGAPAISQLVCGEKGEKHIRNTSCFVEIKIDEHASAAVKRQARNQEDSTEEEDEDLKTCTREMQVSTISCSDLWTETEPSATRKADQIHLDRKKKKAAAHSSKRRRGAAEERRFSKLASQS